MKEVFYSMEIVLIKSFTNKSWRSPRTYEMIESSLRETWSVSVIQTKKVRTLRKELIKIKKKTNGHLFVFNIAEYLDEENKRGLIPAILDELEIPHLGSSADVIRAGLDKAQAKNLFIEKHVPTPRFFVVEGLEERIEVPAEKIGYPLIVKPLHEGGHIGINEKSIVYDVLELNDAVATVLEDYAQPALVEDYIISDGMREFSVGILDGNPRIFAPIEIDFQAMDSSAEILTYDLAQDDLEEICLVDEIDVRNKVNHLAEEAFNAIDAQDYSRVDIRMDDTGFYVLEINTMPGLGLHSFMPQAMKTLYDLNYSEFIHDLTMCSIHNG